MLRVTTKTKKDGKLNCAIKTEKSNISEALGTIRMIRDYVLQNEVGVMTKEQLNNFIRDVLEGKE